MVQPGWERDMMRASVARLSAFFFVLMTAGSAYAQSGTCDAGACSEHGECLVERDVPFCLCEAGYYSLGLSCAAGADEDAVVRARRDPSAGTRIAEIAEAEIGRRARDVGADLHEHP